MNQYGFIRVASAAPNIKVADTHYNTEQIIKMVDRSIQQKAAILVFPELCITGYTCSDLFFQTRLLQSSLESIQTLTDYSRGKHILFAVGAPIQVGHALYNCAVLIADGQIYGIVPKTYLPNYNEFYEKRWFSSSLMMKDTTAFINNQTVPFGTDLIFRHKHLPQLQLGVEICEDLWVPIPPSTYAALNGANLLLNLSASNEIVGKSAYRKTLLASQSARTISAYIYASCGFGESTTDVVFGGHSLIYENGVLIAENKRFETHGTLTYGDIDIDRLNADRLKMSTYRDAAISNSKTPYRMVDFDFAIPTVKTNRPIDPYPFVPSQTHQRHERCKEIFSIQTSGLAKRLKHIGLNKVVIGISGGLDSTLALLVCQQTFDLLGIDHKNIIGVTMPGFGTTDRTYTNAVKLIKQLGITLREIDIKATCYQHFNDIGHDPNIHDITYENSQARERTQLLMDIANQVGGIVIGTGDLSELALGWATYNGDHMSMYAVNISVPKTLVRYLVDWVAEKESNTVTSELLRDILHTPVSPELLPPDDNGRIKQKTEDVVGPYELHDFFLYYLLRFGYTPEKIAYLAHLAFKEKYSKDIIMHWLQTFYRRFFSQQFKRSCLPDGPKVGSICLSPRGDWRMPSDAVVDLWRMSMSDKK